MVYDLHMPDLLSQDAPLPGMPYLPHMHTSALLAMGLSGLDVSRWIETDDDLAAFHAHKRALEDVDRASVYASTVDSEPIENEAAALLEAHLLRDYPDLYRREGGQIVCADGEFCVADDTGPNLWRSSLLVADDIALMQQKDGRYHLVAASICSPSHWRLADKIGRPIREIHDPVEGIHDDLSHRIDRFFDHLTVDRPVRRYNWSLQFGDELFCPGDGAESGSRALFYRAERQSLRRLPESGAIVFTIRVYRCRARDLNAVAGALPALRLAVETAPLGIARYKGFHRYAEALAALTPRATETAPKKRSTLL